MTIFDGILILAVLVIGLMSLQVALLSPLFHSPLGVYRSH